MESSKESCWLKFSIPFKVFSEEIASLIVSGVNYKKKTLLIVVLKVISLKFMVILHYLLLSGPI